jgi:hypothetical protein
VIIWDEGTAEIVRDEPGHLSFIAGGRKLSGGFALTRTGERRWILVKVRDEEARPGSDIVAQRPESVRSGKTWEELARTAGLRHRALPGARPGPPEEVIASTGGDLLWLGRSYLGFDPCIS